MEVEMGNLYKRGNTWWVKYSRNGKTYRESSKSSKKMVAKQLLSRREGEIAEGNVPGILFEKVTFDELANEFLLDYRINKKKSLNRAELSVRHLGKHFSGMKISAITTPRIQAYVSDRLKWTCNECNHGFHHEGVSICPNCGGKDLKKGAANATINRELSALRRMLNLGAKQTPPKVNRVPYIPSLKENNVRKGFLEHGEFIALRDALPCHLRAFATLGYKVGWRVGEIAKLTWSQVDLKQGIIRLETGETKNDDARTVYLDDELKQLLTELWEKRKQSAKLLPWVFLNESGDDRVKRFDKAWKTACKTAKIGVKLFHDFRRTAVRNMVRAGVPERVAMTVSGHKTRSVFDRYNIVNDTDLRLAAQRQQDYLDSQVGTILGTIHDFEPKTAIEKST
jgi:integrase